MNNSQRFCQNEKLKSRKAIASLFEKGKYIGAFPVKLVWQICDENNDYPVKAAFTVSKKNFKRAVDRNYLKRKMREAYRRQKHKLYEFLNENDIRLNIFFIYNDKVDIHYDEIYFCLEKILESLKNNLIK